MTTAPFDNLRERGGVSAFGESGGVSAFEGDGADGSLEAMTRR